MTSTDDELEKQVDWVLLDQQETVGKVLLKRRIQALIASTVVAETAKARVNVLEYLLQAPEGSLDIYGLLRDALKLAKAERDQAIKHWSEHE